jgi:glycerol-3-phosphate dehydrogenase subunit B
VSGDGRDPVSGDGRDPASVDGRVAVIGGGLAGAAAALTIAESGAPVLLVAEGPGATALVAGTLDVAGASPGIPTLPWRDRLRGNVLLPRERLALHRRGAATHPYAQLFGGGEEIDRAEREIEAAMLRLAAWLAPSGLALAGSLAANRLLPSVPGTLRIADYALGPVAGADVLGAAELAVVDLPALEGWDARALARTLAHELDALGLRKLPLGVVHPALPEGLRAEANPARLAAQLDRPGGRAALAESVRGLGAEGRVLLFPPVLGLDASAALVAALEAATGARVGEALAFPPHALCGYRLQRALDAALERAGVERVRGRVRSVAGADGDRLAFVLAGDEGRRIEADAVVLATGRFVGGGLEAGADAVREPLLSLPLYDGDGRRIDGIPAWRSARKGYGNEQPLFSAGVRTDRRLRPLGGHGRPQHPRLFAAGDLLGGFDPSRERTGLGVALLSGIHAGRAAAEALRGPAGASAGAGGMP